MCVRVQNHCQKVSYNIVGSTSRCFEQLSSSSKPSKRARAHSKLETGDPSQSVVILPLKALIEFMVGPCRENLPKQAAGGSHGPRADTDTQTVRSARRGGRAARLTWAALAARGVARRAWEPRPRTRTCMESSVWSDWPCIPCWPRLRRAAECFCRSLAFY